MIYSFRAAIIGLSLSCCFSSVAAQEELSNNERNSTGTPINQDYFVADQFPGTKRLLALVERFHVNEPDCKLSTNIREGHYEYAWQDIDYTLEKFPNHPKALLLAGLTARLQKAPLMAIPYFEKALKLYPQHAMTHAQYGSYLVEIGRVNEGISRLKKATEMKPELAQAYAWLAKAYMKNGDVNLARQTAEQARKLGYKGVLQ
jgi:tetratricopeptide (TPR) repeat protein